MKVCQKVGQMSQLRLVVGSMSCRHCVREVTRWLRDVPGVETVVADARTATVDLAGTMSVGAVLAAFTGSKYSPQVVTETAKLSLDAPACERCSRGRG
jgi:copper chaperone CopZ